MFLIIAFIVFVIVNFYIFHRGYQSLEVFKAGRKWYVVLFWLWALSSIAAQISKRFVTGGWIDTVTTIATFWLGFMLYGLIAVLVIDLVRILFWIIKKRPNFIYANYLKTKAILFFGVLAVLVVVLTYGYINANNPRVTEVDIAINKTIDNGIDLRLVLVSDIHLGTVNKRDKLAKIVDKINALNPDIVLIAGDTYDSSPDPVINADMGVEFERIKSKWGVFAITGNHEYIGSKPVEAMNYLSEHGVTPLIDSTALIDNRFYTIGRNDLRASRLTGVERKSLTELISDLNTDLPVIVMDHQPYNLENAERAGVDLQVSGHTHHGQLWPFNFITNQVYEQDWGYLKKGNTHYYISCGVGFAGPPIRTAGHSEIVLIRMHGN